MKKLETFLLLLSSIAIVANLSFVKGSGLSMIIALTALSIYYLLVTKNWTNQSLSSIDNFKKRLTGWGFSLLSIGVLFTIMIWPQGKFFLILGVVLISLGTFIKLKTPQVKVPVDNSLRPKAILFIIVGITLLFIPKITLVEYKFKDYPGYVNAWKQSKAKPRDMELRQKLIDEYKKMIEQKEKVK
jgi:hypothetical protein